MKKLTLFLTAFLAIMPVNAVLAQTAATETTSVKPTLLQRVETRTENRIQKIEERTEGIKNRIEERKEELNEKAEKIEKKAEEIKNRIEERASSTEKRIEERKEAKKEINKKRILDLVSLTTRKVNAAINRVEILAVRVEERLNILSDKGVVKSETKTQVSSKLTEAKNAINDAKGSVIKIDEAAKLAVESADVKGALKNVKEVAKQIEDKVKLAHSKVVDAVTLIKASLPKEIRTEKSTSTEATTTQN